MNNVILCGRLTADAELKHTQNDIPVTSICIAVNRRYAKGGEQQADFINCVAWRNTAEFISKYFKKGDPITIQGELQQRKYQDKDGNKRTVVEVMINDARFVPAKSNSTDGAPVNNEFAANAGDDDLPF